MSNNNKEVFVKNKLMCTSSKAPKPKKGKSNYQKVNEFTDVCPSDAIEQGIKIVQVTAINGIHHHHSRLVGKISTNLPGKKTLRNH